MITHLHLLHTMYVLSHDLDHGGKVEATCRLARGCPINDRGSSSCNICFKLELSLYMSLGRWYLPARAWCSVGREKKFTRISTYSGKCFSLHS